MSLFSTQQAENSIFVTLQYTQLRIFCHSSVFNTVYICHSSVHNRLRIQYLSLFSTHSWEFSVTLQYSTQSIYVTVRYTTDWKFYICHYTLYKTAENFLSLYSTEQSWEFYMSLFSKRHSWEFHIYLIPHHTVFSTGRLCLMLSQTTLLQGNYAVYRAFLPTFRYNLSENQQYSLHKLPEEHTSRPICGRSIKSCIILLHHDSENFSH